MPQKSSIAAALAGKCPRCREGDIFTYSAVNLSKFTKMNPSCEVCGLQYEVEPGFFIGAMYFSYAVTVALLISVGVALYVLDLVDIYLFIGLIVGIILLLLPFIFRYSRIAFLYLFGGVKYRG